MFGFLIKKAFFDMWDNMFRILIMNLGYILIGGYFALFVPLSAPVPAVLVLASSSSASRFSPSSRES